MSMNHWRMRVTTGAVLLMIALPCRAGGDDAAEIIAKLQHKYDGLTDATISFTQEMQFAVTKNEQSFSGKLWMKRGNRYRIELEEQTIVTDGVSVWSLNKPNNQLFIDKYRDDPKSLSPERVLTRLPETYTPALVGKEKTGEEELTIVKLVPKVKNSAVKWMKVWIDTDRWLMRKAQICDAGENLATYRVVEMKINTGLPDAQFTFTPPATVEVIDLR
jgi:chaperone LolA